MNNLAYLARFGGGRGGAVLLFVAVMAILAVALFSLVRDASTDKK